MHNFIHLCQLCASIRPLANTMFLFFISFVRCDSLVSDASLPPLPKIFRNNYAIKNVKRPHIHDIFHVYDSDWMTVICMRANSEIKILGTYFLPFTLQLIHYDISLKRSHSTSRWCFVGLPLARLPPHSCATSTILSFLIKLPVHFPNTRDCEAYVAKTHTHTCERSEWGHELGEICVDSESYLRESSMYQDGKAKKIKMMMIFYLRAKYFSKSDTLGLYNVVEGSSVIDDAHSMK